MPQSRLLKLYIQLKGSKMERKMFGHRVKKTADFGRTPGQPFNSMDFTYGKEKDGPEGYEGKEHVKYKDPGYSSHEIRTPEDEPHMKSHAGKEEMHEMEDNYHMGVPNQTHYDLEKKIKRARMNMDAPDQEDPKPLRGNIVHNVPFKGEEDTTGEEEYGPHDMQSDRMPKEHRKK